jgi:copper(I)-binding protein
MSFKRFLYIFLVIPFFSHSAVIENVYAKATTGPNGAVFLTFSNPTDAHIKLIGAKTDICDHVELHTHLKDGDIYRMRQAPYIIANPGSMVALQPGGLHIMLMKIKRPLKEGDAIPLTLSFEGLRDQTFVVPVKKGCGCCKHKK